jgi:hypothetical protein
MMRAGERAHYKLAVLGFTSFLAAAGATHFRALPHGSRSAGSYPNGGSDSWINRPIWRSEFAGFNKVLHACRNVRCSAR